MNSQTELAVVGAGPAGIAAVTAAAEAGVEAVLIDAQLQPGGQYFRQSLIARGKDVLQQAQGATLRQAQEAALRRLADSPARILHETSVWGAFPAGGGAGWNLALYGPRAPRRLDAQSVILATGAYDRPIAFPGWTLPGVLTAGGVQAFLKSQQVPPGRRFLLSGTGPLQLAVAAALIEAGAEVVAVLESAKPGWRALRHATALWGQGDRLAEGFEYWRTLRAAHVPIRLGWVVIEARGDEQVEEATICRVDDAWRPLPDTAETLAVDTIAIGFGLIPSTELARSMGCACAFHPEQGGYVPRRDADMQTSLAGVYAVGDGAGIGGATIAQIEGRIAGVAAAHYLGKLPEAALKTAISREQVALRRHRRFTDMLAALFAPKPGIYALADDDTIICRCEEVTLGDIRRAVDAGARDVNTVKGLTRAGMGNCQGRICGELIAHIIAAETGQADDVHAIESAGCLSARPPLHPLPLEVIAQTAGSASDL